MNKYAFTESGVQQWQNELYAQSDTDLWEEAALVAAGLAEWLPHRFELSAEQVAYLAGIDASLQQVWATEIAYAIRHRIAILLDKPQPPSGIGVYNTKLVLSEEKLETRSGAGTARADENRHLTFRIVY